MAKLSFIPAALSSLIDLILSLTYFNYLVEIVIYHKVIPFKVYLTLPTLQFNTVGILFSTLLAILYYLVITTLLDTIITRKTIIKDILGIIVAFLVVFINYGLFLSINGIIAAGILAGILYVIRQSRIAEEMAGILLLIYLLFIAYNVLHLYKLEIPIPYLLFLTITGKLMYHATSGLQELRIRINIENRPPNLELNLILRNSAGEVKKIPIKKDSVWIKVPKDTYYFSFEKAKIGNEEYVADPSAGYITSSITTLNVKLIKKVSFVAKFVSKGLPTGITWGVKINGNKKYTTTGSILFVTVDGESAKFEVTISNVGNYSYKPLMSSGIVSKNNPTVEIEFQSVTQVTCSPYMWIGKIIGNYKVLDLLGIGGTSYVLKAEREGRIYALKIPIISSGDTIKTFEDLSKEFSNLQEISSKTDAVVRLYGIGNVDINNIQEIAKGKCDVYMSYPPYIVMEYMAGGTARELSLNDIFFYSPYWMKIVILIASKIAYALAVIHESGYAHLDVKPQNIFFSSSFSGDPYTFYQELKSGRIKVKLGDLGSAKRIGEKVEQITPPYSSFDQFEAVLYNRGATPQMDVYSLGATIYTLLTREFANPTEVIDYMNKALDAKINGSDFTSYYTQAMQLLQKRTLKLNNLDGELKDIISSMLSIDPKNRPNLRVIGKKMEKLS
ncbi:MAG: serine/threonine-protein kinase [Sulfolobaceae archaeon]|nr:serine/threonine-protein kinase [Sulfolobaceae archaeon]